MNRACKSILKHLQAFPHTSDELREKTKLTEIPARIGELEALGYEISSHLITDCSRGFDRHISRYALIHSPSSEVQK